MRTIARDTFILGLGFSLSLSFVLSLSLSVSLSLSLSFCLLQLMASGLRLDCRQSRAATPRIARILQCLLLTRLEIPDLFLPSKSSSPASLLPLPPPTFLAVNPPAK